MSAQWHAYDGCYGCREGDKQNRRNARSSGVAQAGPGGAVEVERRQDQAEPCNTAPPTKTPEIDGVTADG